MAEGNVERRIGPLVLLQLYLAQHDVVPSVVVERVDGDGFLVVLLGQGVTALVDATKGTQDVVVEGVGVALHGIVAVDFRSLKVLQIELG